MFNDARSKKVILISHCLLNQNSISDGTADLPSQFDEVVQLLMENKIGIYQLPCPEFFCLGLARRDEEGAKRELLLENSRIRDLLMEEENRNSLRIRAKEIVGQIEEYLKHGFQVLGIIGINRSPSCGIETTSQNGKEVPGRGVFMEILEEELKRHHILLKKIGVKTHEKEESLKEVNKLLQSNA